MAGLIIGSPLDVLKVRLQAQGSSPAVGRIIPQNKSTLSTMVQNEGVSDNTPKKYADRVTVDPDPPRFPKRSTVLTEKKIIDHDLLF